jgi:hypothetical protein
MTLPLARPLTLLDRNNIAARSRVDARTVRRYLAGDTAMRPYTIDAIERALRSLGLVARRAARSPNAADRTLPLPYGSLPRPKGGDEEDE